MNYFSSLCISAMNITDGTSFTVEMTAEKTREVLNVFGSDYGLLASCLDIKDNTLIIRNAFKSNEGDVNETANF